jgi:hypothetical protein
VAAGHWIGMTTYTRFLLAMAIAMAGLLIGAQGGGPAPIAATRISSLECSRPASLRLLRFEDGSAQLRCGDALLARISAPG